MGRFWEGVKAGFLGSAGVDYYSMKNNEVLEDIRDSRAVERASSGPSAADSEAWMYLGFLGNVAKPVENAVMVELPKAINMNTLTEWSSWAQPIIERAAATIRATPSPDHRTTAVRDLYVSSLDSYANAAGWWTTGERANGDRWAHHAAATWELAIDAAQDAFATPSSPEQVDFDRLRREIAATNRYTDEQVRKYG